MDFHKILYSRSLRYLAISVVLIFAAVFLVGWQYWDEFKPWAQGVGEAFWQSMEAIHPLFFYVILSLAPTVGVPVTPFFIIAPGLHGIWVAMIGCAVALFIALSVSYWLARVVFRTHATRFIEKRGMQVPQVKKEEEIRLILVLRITPGIPFFVQNMLLGLAKIPFARYMMISFPFQYAWALAFMFLGDSIIKGSKGAVIVAIGMLAGVILLTTIIKGRVKTALDIKKKEANAA